MGEIARLPPACLGSYFLPMTVFSQAVFLHERIIPAVNIQPIYPLIGSSFSFSHDGRLIALGHPVHQPWPTLLMFAIPCLFIVTSFLLCGIVITD